MNIEHILSLERDALSLTAAAPKSYTQKPLGAPKGAVPPLSAAYGLEDWYTYDVQHHLLLFFLY